MPAANIGFAFGKICRFNMGNRIMDKFLKEKSGLREGIEKITLIAFRENDGNFDVGFFPKAKDFPE